MSTSTNSEEKNPDLVSFFVRLSDSEYEPTLRSWRCPALDLPGSSVQDVYARGTRIDKEKYRIIANQSYIRWADGSEPPEHIAAQIIVNSEKRSKIESEKEDARKKEAWWRNFGIIVPIIVALISGSLALLKSAPDSGPEKYKKFLEQLTTEFDGLRPAFDQIALMSGSKACSGGSSGYIPPNVTAMQPYITTIRSEVQSARDRAAQLIGKP